jgi:uncharacterized membrane protein YkoI
MPVASSPTALRREFEYGAAKPPSKARMKKPILFLLCVSLPSLAHMALAQQVSQASFTNADISAFRGDDSTLVNSIALIEQSTGGKVIDIRFSSTANGVPGYNVVIVKAQQVQFFRFEERSKHVVELDASSKPVYMLNWAGKADVHFALQAQVSLSTAIHTAEQSQPGAPAMAAGIARSASNPDSDVHAYNVLLNRGGSVKRVAIDSSTGEVISDPSALNSF